MKTLLPWEEGCDLMIQSPLLNTTTHEERGSLFCGPEIIEIYVYDKAHPNERIQESNSHSGSQRQVLLSPNTGLLNLGCTLEPGWLGAFKTTIQYS